MAVGGAVLQYEQRLSTEQSRAQDQQTAIAELQGQIQALQQLITSQKDLPSVPSEGVTEEGENLRDKVFNICSWHCEHPKGCRSIRFA